MLTVQACQQHRLAVMPPNKAKSLPAATVPAVAKLGHRPPRKTWDPKRAEDVCSEGTRELLLLIHTFSVVSLQLKNLRCHNKSAIDLSNTNPACGYKEVRRSAGHIMVTNHYSDQQGSKSRQKVMWLYKQWHRPMSKRFIKSPYSISRATSIDSECCRLPTTSVLNKKTDKVLSAISRVGDFCILRFLPLYLSVRLLPQRVQHASAYPGGSVSDNKFKLLYSSLVSPHTNKSTKDDHKFYLQYSSTSSTTIVYFKLARYTSQSQLNW